MASTGRQGAAGLLRRALLYAILDLLKIPETSRSLFEQKWLGKLDLPYARITVILHGLDLRAFYAGEVDPHFEISVVESELSVRDDKTVAEKGKTQFKLCGYEGTHTRKNVAIFGPDHPDYAAGGYNFGISLDAGTDLCTEP